MVVAAELDPVPPTCEVWLGRARQGSVWRGSAWQELEGGWQAPGFEPSAPTRRARHGTAGRGVAGGRMVFAGVRLPGAHTHGLVWRCGARQCLAGLGSGRAAHIRVRVPDVHGTWPAMAGCGMARQDAARQQPQTIGSKEH